MPTSAVIKAHRAWVNKGFLGTDVQGKLQALPDLKFAKSIFGRL